MIVSDGPDDRRHRGAGRHEDCGARSANKVGRAGRKVVTMTIISNPGTILHRDANSDKNRSDRSAQRLDRRSASSRSPQRARRAGLLAAAATVVTGGLAHEVADQPDVVPAPIVVDPTGLGAALSVTYPTVPNVVDPTGLGAALSVRYPVVQDFVDLSGLGILRWRLRSAYWLGPLSPLPPGSGREKPRLTRAFTESG